jgi:hypothetical protein
MMRFYILFLFLIRSCSLIGQNTSIVLEHEHYNYIYIGVQNPISIQVQSVPPKDLLLKAAPDSGLKILKSEGVGNYNLLVSKRPKKGQYAWLEVYRKSDQRLLFRKAFRVRQIPDPKVVLTNGQTDGVITAAELRVQQGIMLEFPNLYLNLNCKILGFTAYFMRPGQDPMIIFNRGAKFEATLLQLIQNAQAGDTLQILNVKGSCAWRSCGVKFNGLAFQVR